MLMPVRAVCENDICVFLHTTVMQTDFVLSRHLLRHGQLQRDSVDRTDGDREAVSAVTAPYGLMAEVGNTSVFRESRN